MIKQMTSTLILDLSSNENNMYLYKYILFDYIDNENERVAYVRDAQLKLLLCALKINDLDMLKYVFNRVSKVTCKSLLLQQACRYGSLISLEYLINTFNLSKDEMTECLRNAVFHGHVEIVKYLLANKLAEVNSSIIDMACALDRMDILEYMNQVTDTWK